MNPVVDFDGFAFNYINEDHMNLTVKLVPENGVASYCDIFEVLKKSGVEAEEIKGLYKVGAVDKSWSVLLSTEQTVARLKELQKVRSGRTNFFVTSMAEQVVSLQVHWLPLYYEDRILKAMLCLYGEVVDIKNMTSTYGNITAMNGTREVLLKTDEIRKQQIPHLVNIMSGQSVLITMLGRPPLCLKCKVVGHTRRECEVRRYLMNQGSRIRIPEESHGRLTGPPPAAPSRVSELESVDSAGPQVLPTVETEGAAAGCGGSDDHGTGLRLMLKMRM